MDVLDTIGNFRVNRYSALKAARTRAFRYRTGLRKKLARAMGKNPQSYLQGKLKRMRRIPR